MKTANRVSQRYLKSMYLYSGISAAWREANEAMGRVSAAGWSHTSLQVLQQ